MSSFATELADYWFMYGNETNNIAGLNDRRWANVFPDPWEADPKLGDIKTSASVAILVEFMPDTRVRYPSWNMMRDYCMHDAKVVHDLATDRLEWPMIYALEYDRRYHVIPPIQTWKDEPHWFKHDRKAYR